MTETLPVAELVVGHVDGAVGSVGENGHRFLLDHMRITPSLSSSRNSASLSLRASWFGSGSRRTSQRDQ